MRSLAMVVALAVAYWLLRGFPEDWPTVVKICLAVLVLVAGLGIWGRRPPAEGEVAVSRRRAGWLDYLAIGAAVLVMECLFLVFFSVAPEPLEDGAAEMEEWLQPLAAAKRKQEVGSRKSRDQGNWLIDAAQRRALPKRTNYKPGNRPEVFLKPLGATDTEVMLGRRVYVHAMALSQFRDGAWSAFPGEEAVIRAENDGWLRLGEESRGDTLSCRVFHGLNPEGQNPVTGIQGLVAARIPEVVSLDEGLHWLTGGSVEDGYEYDTISRPRSIGEFQDQEIRSPEGVPDSWLSLPEGEMGRRIGALAKDVAGEGLVVEKLKRIRDHLRTNLAYSLVIENPEDRDPLENFMFYEKRGHCEFFATAGALLARAVGVPSRVAYGWVGGTYYENSDLFVFRAREAHAWAEVWFEGYGWVVVDPTPPGSLARSMAEVAPPGEEAPGSGGEDLENAGMLGVGMPVWKIGLGLSLLFGVPGMLLLIWRGVRRPGGGLASAGGGSTGGGGYLAGFLAGCRKRGVEVKPGTTLRSLLGALESPPEFAKDLSDYHYGVRYEGHDRRPRFESALRRRVEAWRRSG